MARICNMFPYLSQEEVTEALKEADQNEVILLMTPRSTLFSLIHLWTFKGNCDS